MTHLAVFLQCVAALGALALAVEQHLDAVFARALPPSMTRALRATGWPLLPFVRGLAERWASSVLNMAADSPARLPSIMLASGRIRRRPPSREM